MALDGIFISQIGWTIQLIAWWEMYFTVQPEECKGSSVLIRYDR